MPNRQPSTGAPRNGSTSHRYASAGVVTRQHACAAAKALKGKRFLAGECPRLPLADCGSPATCDCIYRKFDDRRAGPRRDFEETGIRRFVTPDQDRRLGRGRRSGD